MNKRVQLWLGFYLIMDAILLGLVAVLGYPRMLNVDRWWNENIAVIRSDWMLQFSLVLNWIGGGWVAILVVPLLTILALVLARRWRGAVFAAVCFAVSAGVVQLFKQIFGRARPEDMLVWSDYGSFPSGHTANAATIAVVVWLLFPRVWIAIAGALWVLAMALSRTFLSVHWVTDTVGGASVGAGVVFWLAVWLLPWVKQQKLEVGDGRPSEPRLP